MDELEKTLKPQTIREIIYVLKSILRYYEENYDRNLKVKCKKLPKYVHSTDKLKKKYLEKL